MFTVFYPLGAKTTLFRTKIFLNTETRFDLYAEGLPENAVILDINFTPYDMFCVEMSGNSRRQRPRGGRLQMYGFHTYTVQKKAVEESKVDIAVTWVESSIDNIAWDNLVSAFDAYADGNIEDAVVPSNVAVEAKIYRYVESSFHRIASAERIRDFLESAATYSYQLNVLLPFLARVVDLPILNDEIRGFLNALREARNSVAHKARCDPTLTKERAGELITAALFGFRYVDYLQVRKASR